MWIGCSILSVSVFMMFSAKCYKTMSPKMTMLTTELVLIPFRLQCLINKMIVTSTFYNSFYF